MQVTLPCDDEDNHDNNYLFKVYNADTDFLIMLEALHKNPTTRSNGIPGGNPQLSHVKVQGSTLK